jgi:hypothetical protein
MQLMAPGFFMQGIARRTRMGVNGNGVNHHPITNGPPAATAPRVPRRLVLLTDGQHSEVASVLTEYHGAEISGKRLHEDVQRLAAEHPGTWVAAEWLGPRGWTRFLWCQR